jgi:hypothetical protein
MDANLQILKFSNSHIITSSLHHITAPNHPPRRTGSKGDYNLAKLNIAFTFKQDIKEFASHGCESSNLQIFKFSNFHITKSLPHLWYIIYPAHGIVVDAAR